MLLKCFANLSFCVLSFCVQSLRVAIRTARGASGASGGAERAHVEHGGHQQQPVRVLDHPRRPSVQQADGRRVGVHQRPQGQGRYFRYSLFALSHYFLVLAINVPVNKRMAQGVRGFLSVKGVILCS